MATILKSFTFDTGPQGIVQLTNPNDPDPDLLWRWKSGDSPSGPGGCMQVVCTTGGLGPPDPVTYVSNFCAQDTWQAWGVPPRKIVTHVQVVDWYQRTVANTLMVRQAAGIYVADNTLTSLIGDDGWLVDPTEIPTTLTAWTEQGPGAIKPLASVDAGRSANRITLVVAYALRTSAGTADIDWRFDDVTLAITYVQDPTPRCPPPRGIGGGGCC